MSKVTLDYLQNLAPIYRDLLDGFWMFNPNHRENWGIAPDSLYGLYRDRYTMGEVTEACEQMLKGGALKKIQGKELFFVPTDELGWPLIELRQRQSGRQPVPAFAPPDEG
jgi:hypothetical protein